MYYVLNPLIIIGITVVVLIAVRVLPFKFWFGLSVAASITYNFIN